MWLYDSFNYLILKGTNEFCPTSDIIFRKISLHVFYCILAMNKSLLISVGFAGKDQSYN